MKLVYIFLTVAALGLVACQDNDLLTEPPAAPESELTDAPALDGKPGQQ